MFPAGPSREYLNKGVFRLRELTRAVFGADARAP